MTEIRLAALELERKLGEIEAFAYQLTFSKAPEDQEPIHLTQRGAAQLSYANRQAVTGIGVYRVVSLQPLQALDTDWQGVRCVANEQQDIILHSNNETEREAIKRLLKQCLMQGAKQLARNSEGRISADYNTASLVELMETIPSQRIPFRSQYLDAFQSVSLTPEVLPDGQALVGFNVRHRLLAQDHITLDWVIRTCPKWLQGIKRVRHRYSSQGKPPLSADFVGAVDGRSALSTIILPQGEVSLLDYHRQKGNIRDGEEPKVRDSYVVRLRYAKDKEPVEHLAALVQPLFDFETLQKIDSPLLEKLARHLKWPVSERLKAAADMVRNLHAGELGGGLGRIENSETYIRRLKPAIRLSFANGRTDDNEKAVIRLGAYRGMTRKLIVPVVVSGDEHEQQAASQHFQAVEKICRGWAKDSPRWTTPPIVSNAHELDARLSQKSPSDALLLIAMGRNADKQAVRDVAFRYGLAAQFMRLDHPSRTYQPTYYNNLAAGVFSKAGGLLCALEQMPGETDLFIGLDLGGVSQRMPGLAFLFTRDGAQLGWQLAEAQRGERVGDKVLRDLLERSLQAFIRSQDGTRPRHITLHRDGRFFESLDVIQAFERESGVGVDVLEVVKSGCPPLYQRFLDKDNKTAFRNPEVGDAFELPGLDELIVATYSGDELGKSWGDRVTVRPLRLRKRYGNTDLHTLAQQVILLSRIHGASLYRHPRLPVTVHHADRFASLRQECNLDDLSKMDRLCPVYL